MPVRRETLLWLAAAREDLEDAEIALERERWFRAAFFSQQAVGKALKALYPVVLKRDPPKIHTVTELYRELRSGGFRHPPPLEESLYILNKYYTVTRYPDAANGLPSESVDREEALRAYRLAVEVVRIVESAEVQGFLADLEREGIRIREAYLFGSYARGDYLETSDIDLVIISPSFRGMRFIDRLEIVYRVAWRKRRSPWIEVIPLTPEEFSEKTRSSFVLRDASKYWIKIK